MNCGVYNSLACVGFRNSSVHTINLSVFSWFCLLKYCFFFLDHYIGKLLLLSYFIVIYCVVATWDRVDVFTPQYLSVFSFGIYWFKENRLQDWLVSSAPFD